MTRTRRAVLALAVALALAAPWPPGPAAQPAGAGALEQLRAFLNQARSARGEFTQKVLRSDGSVAESGSGEFAFERPGRFRWEVRRPFEQLLVADGQRLYFFDKDLNQVTVRRLADALASTPAAMLFGDSGAALEREFALRETGARDGLAWIEAVPRSKEQGFERIAIGFRDGLPGTMEVADAFGRVTVFEFRAIRRETGLGPELFRFVPPKGADVVEQ
ncbi:MAG: outer membrane lipoprotein chaperone LolA [Burkholderiaceae bacterium]|nr:outer membrane lipoprotein chaperone LolA [Burkholderiaceae bacterium]